MTVNTATLRAQPRGAVALHRRGILSLYLELTKARLSTLVLFTTAAGFLLASPGSMDWPSFFWTLLGTALAAGSANALNQVLEVDRDRLMIRTRNRPLPSGAMSVAHGWIFAILLAYAGVGVLAVGVNLLSAAIALATVIIYAFVYTPLKARTTLNTLIGAVCGAAPPVIGWVGASGGIAWGAWALAALLFVWQLPHFFALAWLHRDDYVRGGYAMLPVLDRDGRLTCEVIMLTALLLLPVTLMAAPIGLASVGFAAAAFVMGLWFVVICLGMYRRRTTLQARRVFQASIAYLPALLCLMVLDRGLTAGAPPQRPALVLVDAGLP